MPTVTPIIELVGALVAILLIAAMVLAFCKHFKIPFTVALVVVGIGISMVAAYAPADIKPYFHYKISPELILYVCLPTLLFESALSLNPRQLRRNLTPILTLAIPGLLISTGVIGFIVAFFTPLYIMPALLLGAILSATDPIAVIALFKQLGAPKRLTVLVEGESLFNDATSIVTAKLLFTILIAGFVTSHEVWHGVYEFFVEFFGGILVGWIIAIVIGNILGFVESDPEIEISLTTILAYATFLIAQNFFHVSGVMATVAAGLTLSGWGRAKISPSVHNYLKHFWEFLAYIANALIFILVGLSVNLGAVAQSFSILVVTIIAMFVSRAVITFGLIPLISKLPGSIPISKGYQTAIYWGGLRGAIALAIVLSLSEFEHRETLIAVVTGSVLFTLLFNGLTMEKLVRLLGLHIPPLADRVATEEGKLNATREALDRIPSLQQGGLFSARIANDLRKNCEERLEDIEKRIEEIRRKEMDQKEEEKLLLLRSLSAEQNLYYEMFAKGHLSERAYRNLNERLVNQHDFLRYNVNGLKLDELPRKTKRKQFLIPFFDMVPGMGWLAQHYRALQIARDYEQLWGQYQGYLAVLDFLDKIIKQQPSKKEIARKVYDYFAKWKNETREQLDGITEQFPEFVKARQEQLAKRLLFHAEHDALKKQAAAGTIPAEVAETLQKNLESKMYKLRAKPSTQIEMDPSKLLRKVPFLQSLPESELSEIQSLLESRLVPADEEIITEGEKGQNLFIITRGVVRVSKMIDGQSQDLATLIAGDFFGEMALIESKPRTATCRAVTPCSLFVLKRDDFNKVMEKYPAIHDIIKKAAEERKQG